MGGGSSRPARQQLPAAVRRREEEDPRPTADTTSGISLSQAQKCTRCDLRIGANASTSVVTLTRAVDLTESDELTKEDVCPSAVRIEANGRSNLYNRTVGTANEFKELWCVIHVNGRDVTEFHRFGGPNIAQCGLDGFTEASRTSNGNNRQRIYCTGNGDYYYVQTNEAPNSGSGQYIPNKKLFIRPDKPFQMSFNGTSFAVTQMAIYRPSPIRIDNIQADAVLSLNDYSDPSATHVVLIPIASGVTYGAAGDFIGRVMENLNAFTMNETTKQYNPLTIPVGNDWSLTNVLPTGRGQDNNEVSVGYFQWTSGELERYPRIETPSLIRWGWRQKAGGVTTIMAYEPIRVSYATSTYLSMLPYAPSAESAPPPNSGYVFREGACLTCADRPSVDPAQLEKMKEDAKNAFLDPVKVIAALVALITAIAGFIATYYAISWVLDGGGRFLLDGTMGFSKWFVGVLKGEAQQQV